MSVAKKPALNSLGSHGSLNERTVTLEAYQIAIMKEDGTIPNINRLNIVNSDLPMFHDGPVAHTHQKCNRCLQFRRAHHEKLLRCGGCCLVMYCVYKAEREDYAKKTGIATALEDVWAWAE
ncbi:hypothetical protein PM082_022388 [Marasmius tenuissimus]|nr:hypothetical protein PM082_022388 [Marasmius tenuissimus]